MLRRHAPCLCPPAIALQQQRLERVEIVCLSGAVPAQERRLIHTIGIVFGGRVQYAMQRPWPPGADRSSFDASPAAPAPRRRWEEEGAGGGGVDDAIIAPKRLRSLVMTPAPLLAPALACEN